MVLFFVGLKKISDAKLQWLHDYMCDRVNHDSDRFFQSEQGWLDVDVDTDRFFQNYDGFFLYSVGY